MPPGGQFTSDSDFDLNEILKEAKSKARRNSSEPKYYCSIDGCKESFRRLDHLDRHEYHHTGVKKHHCLHDGCEKSYSILTHLKRHLRSAHERTEPAPKNVACTVAGCVQLFTSTCNMRRHIREVHENPKVYKCAHCSEQFTQKLKMRRHEISVHTGEFPFNCAKCAKGFYQQYHYERHLPLCKIYPCPTCDLKFDKWSIYRKHCKETQHGRSYYKCEQCEHLFNKPSELQRHMLTQHIEGDHKIEFKCSVSGCERSYAYERNLSQHIRIAHGGERFACKVPDCKRDFSSAQNLAKHVEREHHIKTPNKETIAEKTNKERKKRKDAGKPVLSQLAKLSNIAIDKETDKLLRERENKTVSVVASMLEEMLETDEDDALTNATHNNNLDNMPLEVAH